MSLNIIFVSSCIYSTLRRAESFRINKHANQEKLHFIIKITLVLISARKYYGDLAGYMIYKGSCPERG